MEPPIDIRQIAYRAGGRRRDPWPVFATLMLVVFVTTFAFIIAQGRHVPRSSNKPTLPNTALLSVTPQPSVDASASPDPSSTPGPSPPDQRAGPLVAQPYAAPSATPRPSHVAPRPTPTTKPTATDRPPTAILNVTPAAGKAALTVTADASFSWDGDATGIASYQFVWDDGLSTGPQSSATATHVYTAAGSYTVRVIVTDSAGLSSSASATATVI